MSTQATTSGSFENIKNVSVFKYFTLELTRGYLLEREEEKYAQKRQRVYTFMKTPRELEKFCTYGFFQCVDAFLFVFTFLPLRIMLAFLKLLTHPCGFTRSRHLLQPAQICDILKGIILVVCCFIMSYIDTSMMYHIVRGQATIKLYVFFNMLDMADRLLSNFGHDILDALFWTATEPRGRRRDHLGTLPHLILAIIYVIIHTMLILFQATVLNVAFNSYNKSLLVIMMSNNFVEIKGSLFRKVDLNHLYQIACSDVKERFHYVVLLSLVCVRNLTEAKWDLDILWVLLPDTLIVLLAEVCVDWGKHAFILKFNEIPADVYKDYKVKLALDMASSRQNQAFTDHSDLVSRRMGLTPIPLACLIFRIVTKSIKLTTLMNYVILIVILICLTTFKVLNSIILLGHSYKVIEEYDKEQTESSNLNTENSESANQDSRESSEYERTERKESTDTKPDGLSNHESTEIQVENISTTTTTYNDKMPTEKYVKHERSSSCDANVTGNFNEILLADSYSELTMIPNIDVIEHSKDPTSMNKSTLRESSSDNVLNTELDSVSNEEMQQSTNIHENALKSEVPVQETVLTPLYAEKETSAFPKSERFFVTLNQRKSLDNKDLSVASVDVIERNVNESEEDDQNIDDVKDSHLNYSHLKKE